MCGILGVIEFGNARVELAEFNRQLATLTHRGPDDEGVELLDDGRVALGHRRLSIIDLSQNGRQPVCNELRNIWLSFNGEIYNFQKLRAELLQRGHVFRSQTDSEVIVHGYEEWGDAVVDRLEGIFAFGIWDQQHRRLLLARDPVGVKPLYYWHTRDRFIFASQPRAILAHSSFASKIDPVAMQQFLAHRYVPGENSIYSGMKKLPAAHRLVVEAGRVSVERYWRVKYSPTIQDRVEAVEVLQSAVEQAVKSQLVSDVPVGVFLSGGVDSSSLALIATQQLGQSVPAFTMGFEEPAFDERSFARHAAALFSGTLHEGVMTFANFLQNLPVFIETYDEPFFDYSGLFVRSLAESARQDGVPVILAGDGADELFAGYKWYEDPFASPPQSRWHRILRHLGVQRNGDPLDVYFERVGVMGDDRQASLLVTPSPFSQRDLLHRHFMQEVPLVTSLQILDFETFLVDDILLKVDHASMACGVEVRVPFLDRRVIEAAFSIDNRLMFAHGERKALFKDALRKWVPDSVLTTRKKGFGAPLDEWMARGLRRMARCLLVGGALVDHRIVRASALEVFLQAGKAQEVWALLTAEMWARRWLENEPWHHIVSKLEIPQLLAENASHVE